MKRSGWSAIVFTSILSCSAVLSGQEIKITLQGPGQITNASSKLYTVRIQYVLPNAADFDSYPERVAGVVSVHVGDTELASFQITLRKAGAAQVRTFDLFCNPSGRVGTLQNRRGVNSWHGARVCTPNPPCPDGCGAVIPCPAGCGQTVVPCPRDCGTGLNPPCPAHCGQVTACPPGCGQVAVPCPLGCSSTVTIACVDDPAQVVATFRKDFSGELWESQPVRTICIPNEGPNRAIP